MSQSTFRVEKGFSIDDLAHFLTTSGVPGGDSSYLDAAPKGSLALDYTSTPSTVYQKTFAGSGKDKWNELATKLTISWREPVKSVCPTVFANIAAAQTVLNNVATLSNYVVTSASGTYNSAGYPVIPGATAVTELVTVTFTSATAFTVSGAVTGVIGTGTISTNFISSAITILSAGWGDTWAAGNTFEVNVTAGGVIGGMASGTYVSGDRILFTNLTSGNKNVYFVVGTPGSSATLSEDPNTATDGDMVWVQEGTATLPGGTYDGSQWACSNNQNWFQVGATAAAELGYIRTFIGKSAFGSETPNYGASVEFIGQFDDLETAIRKLDAALVSASGLATKTAVTTQVVLDSASVDLYDLIRWLVHAKDNAGNVNTFEVVATHNGTTTADATSVDYSVYGKLKLGNLIGTKISVDLNGVNGAQVIRLLVESTTLVNFKSVCTQL